MTTDTHHRSFIRTVKPKTSTEERQPSYVEKLWKKLLHLPWSSIFRFVAVFSLLAGGLYLLGKLVTPRVLTALYVIAGLLLIRFVVKTILRIAFTLLRYLFWIVVLGAILLCVL